MKNLREFNLYLMFASWLIYFFQFSSLPSESSELSKVLDLVSVVAEELSGWELSLTLEVVVEVPYSIEKTLLKSNHYSEPHIGHVVFVIDEAVGEVAHNVIGEVGEGKVGGDEPQRSPGSLLDVENHWVEDGFNGEGHHWNYVHV